MTTLYIGIDPGESNGLALYDKVGGLRVYTLGFWELIKFVQEKILPRRAACEILPEFTVENPNLNTFIYQQRVNGKNAQQALRIARNVGMNQCDAKRIIEFLLANGLIVHEVRPTSNSMKWNAQYFEALVGHKITCSQHARDAAKLIANRWVK